MGSGRGCASLLTGGSIMMGGVGIGVDIAVLGLRLTPGRRLRRRVVGLGLTWCVFW